MTVTSAYVPVTSVVPAISGTKEIHSRNANSDGQETDGRVAFNPILGSAVVTPANATNADKVMITSDDPDGTIAYYTNGEKGLYTETGRNGNLYSDDRRYQSAEREKRKQFPVTVR